VQKAQISLWIFSQEWSGSPVYFKKEKKKHASLYKVSISMSSKHEQLSMGRSEIEKT